MLLISFLTERNLRPAHTTPEEFKNVALFTVHNNKMDIFSSIFKPEESENAGFSCACR